MFWPAWPISISKRLRLPGVTISVASGSPSREIVTGTGPPPEAPLVHDAVFDDLPLADDAEARRAY